MIKTPLRYAGGKSRAIKIISPYLLNEKIVVSPFMGGGSIEVFLAANGINVIGYDIFDVLVNFWDTLLNDNLKLVDKLKTIQPTVEEFNRIKEILMSWVKTQNMLKDWKTDYYVREEKIELDDITAAAYYFFNHNTSYGPGYLGWASSVYLNQEKWNKMIRDIELFKMTNLSVHESSFESVISNLDSETMYLDPPYFLDKDLDNKMFIGIYPMRNIPVHHNEFNHELLRDMLHNYKGKFVLSYNNCETIREYYKDFELYYPSWNYSLGSGEKRIGKNRKEMGITNAKESHEILIVKR